ncbi:MAG: T9SS type A sorting domain-containing protein [Bacteroidales bacterium]|nr:T9SS type A sorting domain-containing protein [Bacteroidales bacterium]
MKKFLTIFMLFTFVISIQAFSQATAKAKKPTTKNTEMFQAHQAAKAEMAKVLDLKSFRHDGTISISTKGGGAGCPDGSLFSRPFNNPENALASEAEFDGGSIEVATSFQTVGGTIEGVSIWMLSMNHNGTSFVLCNEDPMNVNVRFYENNNGNVGNLEHEFLNLATTIIPANVDLFGNPNYPVSFMTIVLPQDVDMHDGFISVQGTTPASGTNCWLMWVDDVSAGIGFVNEDGGSWEQTDNGCTICLTGTPPTCPAPSNIIVESVTQTSAIINWTENGTATAWNIEYGEAGFAPTGTPTLSGVTERPYTIDNLDPATQYTVYIQAECGSLWAGPFNFFTECDVANVPYYQDFETTTPPALPECTSVENVGSGNAWTVAAVTDVNNITGNALVYNYNASYDANTWFYTRGLELNAGSTYQVSFKYAARSSYFPENLKVAYGTSPAAASMTNEIIDLFEIEEDDGTLSETLISPSADGVYYIGFNCYSEADQFRLYVDDIAIVDMAGATITFNVTDGTDAIEGAEITINEEVLYSDANGEVELFLNPGDYDYTVTKFGFEDYSNSINVVDQVDETVNVTLTALSAFEITFNVSDVNDAIVEAEISILYNGSVAYTGTTTGGTIAFADVAAGTYTYNVVAEGYTSITGEELVVDADATIDVELIENLIEPYGLMVDVVAQDALFSWNNAQGFFDDFESYDDFVLEFGDWILIDVDGSPTYGFQGIDYPNAYAPMAGIIFNSSTTNPSFDSPAYSGDKFVAVFASTQGACDDWLIAPKTMVGPNFEVSFFARNGDGEYQEEFQVFVSTTTPSISEFTAISPVVTCPAGSVQWINYTYGLENYAGQEIYVAIHVTSDDQFYFCLDDFKIGSSAKAFESYNVFLDDMTIAVAEDITETEYTFLDLEFGAYTAGVQAVYSTGVSPVATIDFQVIDVSINGVIQMFTIYPNPSQGLYNIVTDANAVVTVQDISGRTILTQEINANGKIDLTNQPAGIYFLQIEDKVIKLIKE